MKKQNQLLIYPNIKSLWEVAKLVQLMGVFVGIFFYIQFSVQAFYLATIPCCKKMQRQKTYTNMIHPLCLTGDNGRPYTPEKVQSYVCEAQQLGRLWF